ncbi:GNAT family N-acetyltransferase [Paenibacillus doosanensis]|uniref:GNAT family N-acetyltransferase n=1 Tax=Paenibacillus doosanensis TaxID=1229154 RepID=UPI0035C7F876
MSVERIAAYIKRNPGISTVAEIDQIIVGTVLCGHDGRRGTLYHVAVAEEHRRKGIAKEMVERSLSLLKEAGIHTAVLFAHSENVNAVTHWRHSGWTLFSNVLYHLREF